MPKGSMTPKTFSTRTRRYNQLDNRKAICALIELYLQRSTKTQGEGSVREPLISLESTVEAPQSKKCRSNVSKRPKKELDNALTRQNTNLPEKKKKLSRQY